MVSNLDANGLHLLMTSGLVMFVQGWPDHFRVLFVIMFVALPYVFPCIAGHNGAGVLFICAGFKRV